MPLPSRTKYLWLAILLFALVMFRLPGIHTSYYQDEYKWPEIVASGSVLAGTVPHPPLSEKIYVVADRLFSNNNLRVMPLLFSILNAALIFVIVEMLFGPVEALASVTLFTFSFHSILASLMVDTDGQILPAFFLLSALGYYKWKLSPNSKKKIWWLGLCFLGLALGFLTKLSFVIPAGAFVTDQLLTHRKRLGKRIITLSALGAVIALTLLLIALMSAHYFFPSFNFASAFSYWKHFAVLSNRNYFQTMIEFMKSLLYLSPLLVMPILLTSKEIFRKTRLMWIFILLGLAFYLMVFDFSGGALDRYLQFLIVPLVIIGGPTIVKRLNENTRPISFWSLTLGLLLTLGLFAIQFVSHVVPALHPKALWLERITHLRWNFLFPFNGGSGPLGFYISWLFMSLVWLSSLSLIFFILAKRAWQKPLLIIFFMIAGLYNLMFLEEYTVGGVNGSTRMLLEDSLAFIAHNPTIKRMTTYNDIGGFELIQMGKYRKRLYIDPKFDVNQKIATLNMYKEHYLVIDIPRIDPTSVYARYFASCQPIFKESSGYISSVVYDCRNAPDIKNE